jgi:hypothetical protein
MQNVLIHHICCCKGSGGDVKLNQIVKAVTKCGVLLAAAVKVPIEQVWGDE